MWSVAASMRKCARTITRVKERRCLYFHGATLGRIMWRAKFKGMVKRCEDCGFDLAGGPRRGRADSALFHGRCCCGCRHAHRDWTGLYVAGEGRRWRTRLQPARRQWCRQLNRVWRCGRRYDDGPPTVRTMGALRDPDEAVLELRKLSGHSYAVVRRKPGNWCSGCAMKLQETMWG